MGSPWFFDSQIRSMYMTEGSCHQSLHPPQSEQKIASCQSGDTRNTTQTQLAEKVIEIKKKNVESDVSICWDWNHSPLSHRDGRI